jgi:hypothetical protein
MNYDQVKRDASGAVVSTKYDAYAKISDKPQANYHILPSAQKLYESAFGGAASPSAAPLPGGAGAAAASSSSSASASTSSMPPLGGPPPVPGRPPMSGPPPGLGGAPAPPGGEADKAKKKLCQRCEVAKATAKVTIEGATTKEEHNGFFFFFFFFFFFCSHNPLHTSQKKNQNFISFQICLSNCAILVPMLFKAIRLLLAKL